MRVWLSITLAALVGGCTFDPQGSPAARACADPSACRPDEQCYQGFCVFQECAAPADCGALYQYACETGLCRTISCVDGCDGAHECGPNGFCVPRDCVPTREGPPGDLTCSDGIDNNCDGRTDLEDPGCQSCTTDGECDDGKPCNGVERCAAGRCEAGTPVACGPAADACHVLVCEDLQAGACVARAAPNGTACDDGDVCTQVDACHAGTCVGADPITCTPVDACHGAGTCDPGTGVCSSPQLPDGTDCDDGDPCTKNDQCTGGGCGGTTYTCTPTACQATSVCDGTGCATTPVADGTGCSDGDPCTTGDTCTGGTCGGTAYSCVPNLCQASLLCDGSGGCTPTPKSCADAFSCTDDSCQLADGACQHVPNDSHCGAGELCRPTCFGGATGCGAAPGAVRVTCPTPWQTGATPDACALALGGLAGQAPCLSCTAWAGTSEPLMTDFYNGGATCDAGGWNVTTNCSSSNWCYTGGGALAGSYAFDADKGRCTGGGDKVWTLNRTVDTTGLTGVTVCFDYADHNAGANDFLRLEYSTAGVAGPWVQVFLDQAGPIAGVDDRWVRYCAVLPAAAEGQAALGLQFTAQSTGNGRHVYLDFIEVRAYAAACTSRAMLFTSDFGGCATTGWSLNGGQPGCPGLNGDALEADNSSWTIARTVDTRGAEGDLILRFDVAETTNINTGDSLVAQIDAGGGWRTVFAVDGPIRTATQSSTFSVNLSRFNAAANRNAALGVRFVATSASGGHRIDLDNVQLEAVRFTCPAAGVTVGAPVAAGGGGYTVPVSGTTPGALQIECSWDALGADVSGTGSLELVP
ncbi:MAG TPA: hypothetical protein VGQ83_20465 [Polyangia bacterium]|jgi:hypothetical protein